MNKYRIIVGGRGAEIFLHPINEEQKGALREMNLEEENKVVDWDLLNETLNVENWDYADETFTGPFPQPSAYHITVLDEKDEVVWESDEEFYMDESEDDEDYQMVDKNDCLLIEHYVKGNFFEYVIELDGDFVPEKLQPIVVEINEAVSVMKGLKYDGKKLEIDEWGDNWSKDVLFYIF